MTERYDYIAINDRGVYALCQDDPRDPETTTDFIDTAEMRGHRVERVLVAEAVERHRAYIAELPAFAGLISGTPSPRSTGDR